MMKNIFLAGIFCFGIHAIAMAADTVSFLKPIIPNKIEESYIPSPIVQFTGILNEHIIINLEKRLLQIDSATLLSGFVHRPGAQVWIGEHVGKFLFSASYTYRYTHDQRIKALMDDMVKKYIATQLPNGYLGTYLPKDYWTEWDVWAHKYAIIGLLNYYSITGYAPALETAKKAADLICSTFGNSPGQRDLNLAGWHAGLAPGSILEPMVDLYRYTGDKKYLAFSEYILKNWESPTGPKIMSGLAKYGKVTKVGNAKAYEMLSCFVGILKYYKLTGDQQYLTALQTAWQDIVKNRLYITGTASKEEIFRNEHELPAENSDNMGEGCVTVTWIQFNEQLLKITGDMKYADEIEKSVYNHLFAAENPETGCVSYYTALQGPKPYRCDQGYSCCLSSIPRGISMIPYMVSGKINQQLCILLYEPGQIIDTVFSDAGEMSVVKLVCTSNFPADGKLVYRLYITGNKKLALIFRIPPWSAHIEMAINGVDRQVPEGPFLKLERKWKNGDSILLNLDMSLKVIHGGASYPHSIAFKRGPQVLALDSTLNPAYTADMPLTLTPDNSFQVSESQSTLPAGWVGRQVYALTQTTTQKKLRLVPFADAGQQSGSLQVWIPQSSKSSDSH